ncbi:MAG: GNAT family N-acetyltransferase [Deltaproteobacteria bacterium]|nr:GNAT family N-acetyltransferase [Deltaproteobacteria bacterium]
MATASKPSARAGGGPEVRALRAREREQALAHLRPQARDDLFLMDLVRQVGAPAHGDVEAEVLGAWRGDVLVGLASLRPTIALEAGLDGDASRALLRALGALSAGLVRAPAPLVARLWDELARRGRRALVDRLEASLVLGATEARLPDPPAGVRVRPAGPADLDPLVEAARASLREERRPDPFLGDPRGFRRWVASRLGRALLAERAERVLWVGYADVRLAEGWLLQGVYTWPEARRQGLAAAGVGALCRQAFAAGAAHVQLSVVEGNRPALALYERLGFRPHATLRTLLFA